MAIRTTEDGVRTIHWSAILAGAFTSIGVWLFLYALGAAIGGAGERNGPTTWTAIYTLIAPVIAFFVGGLVLSRARGIDDRADGALHAIVMWGFGLAVGTLLLSILGAEVMFHIQTRVNIPDGYFWAVAGSALGSLITAVLGSLPMGRARRIERRTIASGDETVNRREVYP